MVTGPRKFFNNVAWGQVILAAICDIRLIGIVMTSCSRSIICTYFLCVGSDWPYASNRHFTQSHLNLSHHITMNVQHAYDDHDITLHKTKLHYITQSYITQHNSGECATGTSFNETVPCTGILQLRWLVKTLRYYKYT